MNNNYELTYVPDLIIFENLKELHLYNLTLTKLPKLPNSLEHLDISKNKIDDIVDLPKNLKYLDCYWCLAKKLILPEKLEYLNCKLNCLEELILPPKLKFLDCSNNYLKTLTNIPLTLETLKGHNNNWEQLDIIPNNIIYLDLFDCSGTKNIQLIIMSYSNRLQKLIKENEALKKENTMLHDHIKYMPLGEGYEEAKEHFNELVKK